MPGIHFMHGVAQFAYVKRIMAGKYDGLAFIAQRLKEIAHIGGA